MNSPSLPGCLCPASQSKLSFFYCRVWGLSHLTVPDTGPHSPFQLLLEKPSSLTYSYQSLTFQFDYTSAIPFHRMSIYISFSNWFGGSGQEVLRKSFLLFLLKKIQDSIGVRDNLGSLDGGVRYWDSVISAIQCLCGFARRLCVFVYMVLEDMRTEVE